MVYAFTIHDSPGQNYDKICGVFWLNIAKFKVNWCYRYCFKLFSNMRKEKELRQYHCRNSTKVGERNFLFSAMVLPQFLLPILLPGWVLEMWVRARKIKWRGKKKFGNCGNVIAKIGGINFWQLWQWHCRKWEKKCYEICERVKKSCHIHNIFTIFSQ